MANTFAQCNESYAEENIIPILPIKEDDKKRLIERGARLAEQGLTHSLKKAPGSKKRKKNATIENSVDGVSSTVKPSEPKNRMNTSTPAPTGINNTGTASLTARVLGEQEEKKKRRKMMGLNENLDSLFTKGKTDGSGKGGDFMTRGYSIPASARR